MQKFVEITRKDKGFDKENSWPGFCQKEKIPFITLKARSKLTTVQWDYITTKAYKESMTAKPELTTSSLETGNLGVLHLKRYWHKCLPEVEDKLDRDSVKLLRTY